MPKVIGTSVCDSMGLLQTLVDAVDELVNEVEESSRMDNDNNDMENNDPNKLTVIPRRPSTISSLQKKLETMLGKGGDQPQQQQSISSSTPRRRKVLQLDSTNDYQIVNIHPSEDRRKLCIQLEIVSHFHQSESVFLDLDGILRDKLLNQGTNLPSTVTSFITKQILPKHREGMVVFEGVSSIKIDLEVESTRDNGIEVTIMAGTGMSASYSSNGNLDFGASIGLLSASVDGNYWVGRGGSGETVDNDNPLSFDVTLNNDYIVSNRNDDGINVSDLDSSFVGSVGANLSIHIPKINLDATTSFKIIDLDQFFLTSSDNNDRLSSFEASLEYDPSTLDLDFLENLNIFDTLLLEGGDVFGDGLDSAFRMVEDILFGSAGDGSSNGISSAFNLPFLQRGALKALGVSAENNFLASIRRVFVPGIRDYLNERSEELQIVGMTNQRTLQEDTSDLLSKIAGVMDDALLELGHDRTWSWECLDQDLEPVDCATGDVSSVEWEFAIRNTINKTIPLDFHLDTGFPLHISLDDGEDNKGISFEIGWNYKLSFGLDKDDGFYIRTFPNESELSFGITLDAPEINTNATLFFLTAEMENLNLCVGGWVFIDLPLPDGGRLSLGNARRIRDIASTFDVTAKAGAALSVPKTTLGVDFGEVSKWIPALTFEIAAQIVKEVGIISPGDMIRIANEQSLIGVGGQRALGVHRLLAFKDPNDFASGSVLDSCPVNENSTVCAKVIDVRVEQEAISAFLKDSLGRVTEYLGPILEPLDPLIEPIPGLSDILRKDVTGK